MIIIGLHAIWGKGVEMKMMEMESKKTTFQTLREAEAINMSTAQEKDDACDLSRTATTHHRY